MNFVQSFTAYLGILLVARGLLPDSGEFAECAMPLIAVPNV